MTKRLTADIDLETGVVVHETYRQNNKRHRDPREGPAEIWRDASSGVAFSEDYMRHGQLHREGGPAHIGRNPSTGAVTVEEYCRKGLMHRDPKEGPAELRRDYETARVVVTEGYYQDEVLHRDPADGPAFIVRDRVTGAVTERKYRWHGKAVAAPVERQMKPSGKTGTKRDRSP